MEYMAGLPDGAFDLAVVDPPYGIGMDGVRRSTSKHGGRKAHAFKGWDKSIPSKEYFDELYRVSKEQVIWGANYYPQYLKGSPGWILWDKGQRLSQADGELAYTSIKKPLRIWTQNRCILLTEGTIHPTQKPVQLYKWILENYAKPGQRILDTHLGSGSSAIAAHYFGVDFVGCEIDKDYFEAAKQRFDRETRQLALAV